MATKKTTASKTSAGKAAARKPAAEKRTAKKTVGASSSSGFSAEERAAMKERAKELKAGGKGQAKAEADARAVQDAIAAMPPADRELATRVHELVTAAAPGLAPRTWYGMPAYAQDGKVVCFFKAASKFKTRYATFGFEEAARVDEGTMWTTSFGITALTEADERKLSRLVKKAVR
jgi:uncharacterized protein YdhG (YjbR/CyaY superfamily)